MHLVHPVDERPQLAARSSARVEARFCDIAGGADDLERAAVDPDASSCGWRRAPVKSAASNVGQRRAAAGAARSSAAQLVEASGELDGDLLLGEGVLSRLDVLAGSAPSEAGGRSLAGGRVVVGDRLRGAAPARATGQAPRASTRARRARQIEACARRRAPDSSAARPSGCGPSIREDEGEGEGPKALPFAVRGAATSRLP